MKCPNCGRGFVARTTLDGQDDTKRSRPASTGEPFPTLPAEFGRYRVLKLLGRGGMGAVYLAADTHLGREVALKIPFVKAADAVRAERFVREARSAAALHHPNICTVFDAGKIDGRPFITMAYVAGTPLDAAIDPEAPLPPRRAAEIARKVALALEVAHQKGIVHRDLKPSNVMIAAGGEPVVMDFGLAKQRSESDPGEARLTRAGGIVGTPGYMSPEQVRGDAAIGPATDVYSLGVMLFEMLTGHLPYSGTLAGILGQIIAAPVPPVRDSRPDVDPRLDAVCRTAMAKDPAARFPSMARLAKALDDCSRPAAGRPVPPAVATIDYSPFEELAADPPPARRPGHAGRKRLVGAAVLLATLGLLGWAASVVLRVETPSGTLVVELDGADVDARVKDGKLVLTGADGKDRYTITPGERDKKIDAGAYKVRVEGVDGLSLDTSEFTLKKGGTVIVRVTAAPAAVAAKSGSPPKIEETKPATGGPTPVPLRVSPAVIQRGEWRVENKELVHESSDLGRIFFGDKGWTDFDLSVETKPESGGKVSGSAIMFRAGDTRNYHAFAVGMDGGKLCQTFRSDNVRWQKGLANSRAASQLDRWQTVQVRVRGNRIRCSVDGTEVFDFTDARYPNGQIGLGAWRTVVRWRNVKVTDPAGKVLFEGLPDLRAAGREGGPPPADATEPAFQNALGMAFEAVPAGKAWLGGTGGKAGSREYAVARPFFIGRHAVTQAEWQAVTGPTRATSLAPGPARTGSRTWPTTT